MAFRPSRPAAHPAPVALPVIPPRPPPSPLRPDPSARLLAPFPPPDSPGGRPLPPERAFSCEITEIAGVFAPFLRVLAPDFCRKIPRFSVISHPFSVISHPRLPVTPLTRETGWRRREQLSRRRSIHGVRDYGEPQGTMASLWWGDPGSPQSTVARGGRRTIGFPPSGSPGIPIPSPFSPLGGPVSPREPPFSPFAPPEGRPRPPEGAFFVRDYGNCWHFRAIFPWSRARILPQNPPVFRNLAPSARPSSPARRRREPFRDGEESRRRGEWGT